MVGSDMKVRVGASNFIFLNPNLRSNIPQKWRNRPTNEESYVKTVVFWGVPKFMDNNLAESLLLFQLCDQWICHELKWMLESRKYWWPIRQLFWLFFCFRAWIFPSQFFRNLSFQSPSWSHSALDLTLSIFSLISLCSHFFLALALVLYSLSFALPLLFLSFHTPHTHVYTHMCAHTHTVDAWLKIVLALPRINPPTRPFKVCNDRVCFYDLSQSKYKSERFRLGF